jgi:Ribosomal protein L19E
MSIELTKRIAARSLKRGVNAIRIKDTARADASKAITTDDVRVLLKNGNVYAIPKKKNLSKRGKERNVKKAKGRGRGPGRKRGTYKARTGRRYPKKVRAQRRVLKELKSSKSITNEQFKRFYSLVKGGTFGSKAQLLNNIMGTGVQIDGERFEKLKHM